jgi:hypothetical protein
MEKGVEYKAEWMGRVGNILNEYDEEYDDMDMEKMDRLYPGYTEMDADAMSSEIDILRRKADGAEESGEREDIEKELGYVSRLMEKKARRDKETEYYLSSTHKTLKEEIKTLLVLGRMAKGRELRRDYVSRIGQITDIIENLGFDPNEAGDELDAEEGSRRREEEEKAERERLAEEAAERYREAEAERERLALEAKIEAAEGDKDKTEYWKMKLEEWEREKSKPKEPEKPDKGKELEKLDRGKEPKRPHRGEEYWKVRREEWEKSKKPDKGKKPEKSVPGVDTEWLKDTFNFENILFQVAEDAIPEEDQPIFSGDSKEIMLKDVREDLTRYERFKSWVEDNLGVVIAAVMVSVAALLTAVIIQTRKLASRAANSTHGGGPSPEPSPSPFPLPDIVRKLIKFISSNLWVIAVGLGLVLLYKSS